MVEHGRIADSNALLSKMVGEVEAQLVPAERQRTAGHQVGATISADRRRRQGCWHFAFHLEELMPSAGGEAPLTP